MTATSPVPEDQKTASAFATSWNNLPEGSVYTFEQFEDWMSPIGRRNVENKKVLELGCGNGSLMVHMAGWNPVYLEGVDLGSSVSSALVNMEKSDFKKWKVTQADLTKFNSPGFDVVYCIGVVHHLKDPKKGLDAVVRNTKPGGRFHVWVYAKEGNGLVIWVVDPLRKIASRLPWWLTKYAIATPLAVPFYLYAKILAMLPTSRIVRKMPLYEYSLWISKREFAFFRHVAFDQLVTPQTVYISRSMITEWMKQYDTIDQTSAYCIMRNGNSWKFGARIKA